MKCIGLVLSGCIALSTAFAQQGTDPRVKELLLDKDTISVQKKLAALRAGNNENDHAVVLNYYNQTQQAGKADSTLAAIKTKHPKGRFAFIAAGNAEFQATNAKEKQKQNRFLTRFKGKGGHT